MVNRCFRLHLFRNHTSRPVGYEGRYCHIFDFANRAQEDHYKRKLRILEIKPGFPKNTHLNKDGQVVDEEE